MFVLWFANRCTFPFQHSPVQAWKRRHTDPSKVNAVGQKCVQSEHKTWYYFHRIDLERLTSVAKEGLYSLSICKTSRKGYNLAM